MKIGRVQAKIFGYFDVVFAGILIIFIGSSYPLHGNSTKKINDSSIINSIDFVKRMNLQESICQNRIVLQDIFGYTLIDSSSNGYIEDGIFSNYRNIAASLEMYERLTHKEAA